MSSETTRPATKDDALDEGVATDDAVTGGGDRDDGHSHGPQPSFEWILQGERQIVLPHLKSIAPALTWEDEHFHIREMDAVDEHSPDFFRIELGSEPVGAIDFMPLPAERTLMRLYLCSDLGSSCLLDNGDDVIQGFATAWLGRLNKLGFLSSKAAEGKDRPLGFRTPDSSAS